MIDQETVDGRSALTGPDGAVFPRGAVQLALSSLGGAQSRLQAGIAVADIGCSLGVSTVLMAHDYPKSAFVGSDPQASSIELARTRAEDAGVADRVRFEVAPAAEFSGGPYDLVTTFGSLHDLGDLVAAAVHVRDQLADDGTWLVVEPRAWGTVSEQTIRRVVTEAGFTQLLRVAETPFSLVYGVRP